jgi:PhnB protein
MQIQPYLFFNGRCEEAIEFYRQALGAQVDMLMRFKDSPEPPPADRAPVSGDKVMHAAFRIGDSVLMASDGMAAGNAPEFKGFSLSLNLADEAQARRVFDALAQGGNIVMPLAKTFYASIFGMVRDRFGVQWMVGVMPAK